MSIPFLFIYLFIFIDGFLPHWDLPHSHMIRLSKLGNHLVLGAGLLIVILKPFKNTNEKRNGGEKKMQFTSYLGKKKYHYPNYMKRLNVFYLKSGRCIMCLTLKWCSGSPNPINLSKAVREKPIA